MTHQMRCHARHLHLRTATAAKYDEFWEIRRGDWKFLKKNAHCAVVSQDACGTIAFNQLISFQKKPSPEPTQFVTSYVTPLSCNLLESLDRGMTLLIKS